MLKLWRKYLELLDAELSAKIFDNLKNLLVIALLFAAGAESLHGDHRIFLGLFVSNLTGWGVIAVSALLLALNMSDGLHRLAKLRYHTALQVLLFLLYLIVALRVVEIVWSYRAA
ncbi:hypothetical protein JQX08_19775 [Pseudomonas sp. UL073]|uniref:Uncharacterized protein n=1 Tax=Zestomonas insulae TaxID=2809017 RepID=A0ABS2ILT3_9GAMM|nr:hypothetical protein [Pseudomonas insulae]MBM7062962.1 hypothetical protein [Pseudomonas insulae]